MKTVKKLALLLLLSTTLTFGQFNITSEGVNRFAIIEKQGTKEELFKMVMVWRAQNFTTLIGNPTIIENEMLQFEFKDEYGFVKQLIFSFKDDKFKVELTKIHLFLSFKFEMDFEDKHFLNKKGKVNGGHTMWVKPIESVNELLKKIGTTNENW
jgi:hypothetical protein